MRRNEFIIKTVIMMASNSHYHWTWIAGKQWAKDLVRAATELADEMESIGLISPDADGT